MSVCLCLCAVVVVVVVVVIASVLYSVLTDIWGRGTELCIPLISESKLMFYLLVMIHLTHLQVSLNSPCFLFCLQKAVFFQCYNVISDFYIWNER